jgi:putative ABC transport system permease protein
MFQHFSISQIRHRPGRALALGVAILVASLSFVLLASAAKTSALRTRGSVHSNFRAAYDILVRPRGSKTALERSQGLVRDNYLSGVFGGISFTQYARIRTIRGVDVAAPIANVGYILPPAQVPIRIQRFLDRASIQIYRIRYDYVTPSGSRYPAGNQYVYYTRRGVFELSPNPFSNPGQLVGGRLIPVCKGLGGSLPAIRGPFDLNAFTGITCFSGRTPDVDLNYFGIPQPVGTYSEALFPIFVAAIDPKAEAKLLGLDRTLIAGRYLKELEAPTIEHSQRFVPVIASTRTYVGETLDASIQRLHVPSGVDVPRMLATGTCISATSINNQCTELQRPPPGAGFRDAYTFLNSLNGPEVGRTSVSFDEIYKTLLHGYVEAGRINAPNYWRAGTTRYRLLGPDRLGPLPVRNPLSIYKSTLAQVNFSGYLPSPQDNRDLQFRRLRNFVGDNFFDPQTNVLNTPRLRVVGRYEPRRLPGFSPLSKVPLETYYPPELYAANAASRKALGNAPLLPTQNLGDYIQQPPLLLMNLRGLQAFITPKHFHGVSPLAPISAIRVRVKGVSGPDPLSIARIRAVALAIHQRTGLDVDITAGSSPHPLTVELPKGKFGRPALSLREGWSKKGVSISFLRAVDRKSLVLFAFIPLICAFFLGNSAVAAVRTRRGEIGTLLTFGWSPAAIFRVVLGELLLIGLLAGLAGTGLAAVIVAAFALQTTAWVSLLVLPMAVLLALVSGIIPAARAARSVPLDAVLPAIAGRERSGSARRLSTLALVNLRRVPLRSAIAVAGLAVAVAAFSILLAIDRAFQGTLVGTLLGNAISLQVSPYDFASVGLVVGLAALAVADVLYLNLRERAAEFVTLRTVGWGERHLAELVTLEALALGVIGGGAGAAAGFLVGSLLLGVSAGPLALTALAGLAGALLVTLAASLLPLSQLRRLSAPVVLAAE